MFDYVFLEVDNRNISFADICESKECWIGALVSDFNGLKVPRTVCCQFNTINQYLYA